MSEIEAHKGKLVPMILDGWTPEDRAESACKKLNFEKQDYHSDWMDCLKDKGYRKVYVRGGVIYEVQDHELDPNGFSQATKNDDHTIDYCMMYHNGGAGFDEVLAEAINREDKDDSDD